MQIASTRRLEQISHAKRCQEMAVYLTRPSYKAETVANMENGFDTFLCFFFTDETEERFNKPVNSVWG